jgi:hypothetical protein
MSDKLNLAVDDRVRFDGKRTSWRVRGHTASGRYTVVTASFFGEVAYSIIDWEDDVRGALNVIGGGMGIDTTSGPDPAIDETIGRLEEGERDVAEAEAAGAISSGHWAVSHRNYVPLNITGRTP